MNMPKSPLDTEAERQDEHGDAVEQAEGQRHLEIADHEEADAVLEEFAEAQHVGAQALVADAAGDDAAVHLHLLLPVGEDGADDDRRDDQLDPVGQYLAHHGHGAAEERLEKRLDVLDRVAGDDGERVRDALPAAALGDLGHVAGQRVVGIAQQRVDAFEDLGKLALDLGVEDLRLVLDDEEKERHYQHREQREPDRDDLDHPAFAGDREVDVPDALAPAPGDGEMHGAAGHDVVDVRVQADGEQDDPDHEDEALVGQQRRKDHEGQRIEPERQSPGAWQAVDDAVHAAPPCECSERF